MATTSNDTVEIQIPRDLYEELRDLASQVDYQGEELTVLLLRALLEAMRKEGRLGELVAADRRVADEIIGHFMDRYSEALRKLAS